MRASGKKLLLLGYNESDSKITLQGIPDRQFEELYINLDLDLGYSAEPTMRMDI